MSPDTAQTVGISALAFGLLKVLEISVKELGRRKNGNGAAGDKSPEFWEQRMEAVMERVMTRRNALIEKIVREEVESVIESKFRVRGL